MPKAYRCPLCKSRISKVVFDRVTNIEAERERAIHLAHQQTKALRTQVAKAKEKAKVAKAEGLKAGKDAEKGRQERLTKGLRSKLAIANDRIRQLERGSTPQTEGLEFEDKLQARLRKEFPTDLIVWEGKGGDVLHHILAGGKEVGLLLFECKRTPRIETAFVAQALRDRKKREADFVILVASGRRRGFAGLSHEGPVIIASPMAVLPIVHILRTQLLEIAKAHVSQAERERIALSLLEYIVSPQFRVPIEDAVAKASRARRLLEQEVTVHLKGWEERAQVYASIEIDLGSIEDNIRRVREGEEPLPIPKPRIEPLRLPVTAADSIPPVTGAGQVSLPPTTGPV